MIDELQRLNELAEEEGIPEGAQASWVAEKMQERAEFEAERAEEDFDDERLTT